MVAIVSLGARRAFALRPKTGGRGLRLQVGHGDLLVMGGSCQRTWLHSIPKVASCLGARISIQFRPQWGDRLTPEPRGPATRPASGSAPPGSPPA
jgi:hypothetical protein